jgi:SulP family sulfate permease
MATETVPTGIRKYLPILGWLPGYQSGWLRLDLVAGLTAAAVVIPQAMAYATIVGLPVQVGLYVALTPMLVYTLLGTSRRLSVSSTSAISIITGTALLTAVGPARSPSAYILPAATLAFLVGVFLILASLLRLGFLADFISLPVLTGFKAGIGVVIFVSQLGKVLGLSIPSGSILHTLGSILINVDQINWPTVVLAAFTLAILIILPRFVPRIPAALVAVVFGIVLSALFDLTQLGISLLGDIPTGLPSFSLPDLSLVSSLWLPATGIALMSFTESIAAARAFRKFGEPVPDANQELLALGMANIAGGFFQAYPAGGGTSQTAVNAEAGAKSQIAALATVGVVVLTLLFLAPLISLMPEATLGALVLVAAAGLVKIGEFRDMAQVRRTELILALLAVLGVVVLGTLEGILVAVFISILTLLAQADRPSVYALGRKPGSNVFRPLGDHPDDETFAGLLIARTEGRLFFANVSWVVDKLWSLVHQVSPQVLVLDCDAIPDIEYTALRSLTEFEGQLSEAGVSLCLVGLNPTPRHVVGRSPLAKTLGGGRLFPNLEEAVEAIQSQHLGESAEEGASEARQIALGGKGGEPGQR